VIPENIAIVIDERDTQHYLSLSQVDRLSKVIYKVSFRNNIAPSLILAVIEQESMYKPHAVSNKQCNGLMQLDKRTAKEVAQNSGYGWYADTNIEDNITIGVRYLAYLHRIYKKWSVTLTVYNIGIGTYSKNKQVNKYAKKILKKQKTIEKLLW
jgi:soluble lytic murein transglycosylase-like protein